MRDVGVLTGVAVVVAAIILRWRHRRSTSWSIHLSVQRGTRDSLEPEDPESPER